MVCILAFTLHFLPQCEAVTSRIPPLSPLHGSSETFLSSHQSHDNPVGAETWHSSPCASLARLKPHLQNMAPELSGRRTERNSDLLRIFESL